MIDSLGGPVRVNNLLATLDMKSIDHKNLQKMEKRAGEAIEAHAVESTRKAALDAFRKEMEYVYIHFINKISLIKLYTFVSKNVCPSALYCPSVLHYRVCSITLSFFDGFQIFLFLASPAS